MTLIPRVIAPIASVFVIGSIYAAGGDVLLMNSGRQVEGRFLSVSLLHVTFETSDGLQSDYPRDQVLGVFAAGEKPSKPAKQDELGVGGTSVKGVLISYRAKDPYALYAKAKREAVQVRVFSPKETFRYLKLPDLKLLDAPTFQGIAGTWRGSLYGRLPLTITVTGEKDEDLSAVMKFGARDREGTAFDTVTIKGRTVRMEAGEGKTFFEGEIDEKGMEIKGKWGVAEKGIGLILKRDVSEAQVLGAMESFDRGDGFARSTLAAMKQLQEKRLDAAISLAQRYFDLKPTGTESQNVRKQFDRLKDALSKEVGGLFQISSVKLSKEADNIEYLTYHINSKWETFDNLRCDVWVQIQDGSVAEASFTYYTLRAKTQHHDSVAVPVGLPKAVRYRVVLEYEGILASSKEGGPPGEPGWWLKSSHQLDYWGTNDFKTAADKKPTFYFSHTLGKKTPGGEK